MRRGELTGVSVVSTGPEAVWQTIRFWQPIVGQPQQADRERYPTHHFFGGNFLALHFYDL